MGREGTETNSNERPAWLWTTQRAAKFYATVFKRPRLYKAKKGRNYQLLSFCE